MAKPFKNEDDFKKFILVKCKNAIEETQYTAMKDVQGQAQAFYDDYTPKKYERTGQLTGTVFTGDNFIQMSPVNPTGNGYEASVYLNADSLRYTTGSEPSGEQVVSAAVSGGHGASGLRVMHGGGVKLWNEELQKKATDDLVRALKKQGVPI